MFGERPIGTSMALGAVLGTCIVIVRRASRASSRTRRRKVAFLVRLDSAVLAYESVHRVIDQTASVDIEGTLWRRIEDVVLMVSR